MKKIKLICLCAGICGTLSTVAQTPQAKPTTELLALSSSGSSDCTCKGFPLYGKVQVVDAFPDLKVQVVDAFPDLKVQVVDVFPDECGKWKFVDVFPDLKVQFVDAFPDLKIQFVQVFPGIP